MMDPISDFFIRIQNATRARHETVQVSYSKFKHELARALERAGLVGKVEKRGRRMRTLEVTLLYRGQRSLIEGVRLFSKPSRRLYTAYRQIPTAHRGGAVLLTTSQGVLTHAEARQAKVGGQLIAEVW